MSLSLPTQSLPVAFSITLIGALTMVGGVTALRSFGLTTPLQGRKLMHLATGPVFILTWLLYPQKDARARFLAASVPFSVALYFYANSRGWTRNGPLIQTVSRSGDRSELSHGPFYYGLLHATAAALYWTDSPSGVVALIILCLGDGIADLIGRPYGRTKWSHNREKSLQGSAAFVIASLIGLYAYITLFKRVGLFQHVSESSFQWQLPLVVLASALVESLPLGNFDNVAVFACVVAMGRFFGW